MTTRSHVLGLGAVVALAVGIGTYVAVSSAQGRADAGPPFMRHTGPGMMQGMGPGMMGHDPATRAQMGVVHELFVNYERIRRTVTSLPDGIRTVTESDDPRVAQLLTGHVTSMNQRVAAGDDPGLPIESEALRSIFRNYDKIETRTEITEKGVVVVQTSTDPATVAALQQHASEVSDFVKEGMVAMHRAMMKNGGGMMRGMHGAMQENAPNDGSVPAK